MQNKYLIKASRKFWFWFWTKLMNGFAPSDLHGNYKRPRGITINSEYDINNENGQIYLLVGNSCPWCQRTLLVHEIKPVSYTHLRAHETPEHLVCRLLLEKK